MTDGNFVFFSFQRTVKSHHAVSETKQIYYWQNLDIDLILLFITICFPATNSKTPHSPFSKSVYCHHLLDISLDTLWLFKVQILTLPSALQSASSHRPKLSYAKVWGKKTALHNCNCKQKSIWLYTHYTYIYSESNLPTLVSLHVS